MDKVTYQEVMEHLTEAKKIILPYSPYAANKIENIIIALFNENN